MAEYHILSFWLLLTIWKTTSSLERICNENGESNQEYLGICETYHPNHVNDTNDVDDFYANVTQNKAMVININIEEPNTESSPLLDDLNGRRRSIIDESNSIQNCRKHVISFYFVILAGMGMYVCMLLGALVPYFVAVLDESLGDMEQLPNLYLILEVTTNFRSFLQTGKKMYSKIRFNRFKCKRLFIFIWSIFQHYL